MCLLKAKTNSVTIHEALTVKIVESGQIHVFKKFIYCIYKIYTKYIQNAQNKMKLDLINSNNKGEHSKQH